MMRLMQTMMLAVLVLVLLPSWHVAHAKGKEGDWRQNTQYLPSYCAYRATPAGKTGGPRKYPALKSVWIHIHHYCAGIYAEYQAKLSIDPLEKKRLIGQTANEMRYVGRNCPPKGCILYPELHTRWGWALREQGHIAAAVEHYRAAIKAKPDYIKAYSQLADLYMDSGRIEDARKVLEEGLRIKPKSRSLKRRLKKLEQAG